MKKSIKAILASGSLLVASTVFSQTEIYAPNGGAVGSSTNGNVGIGVGVTTPDEQLDVEGNIDVNGNKIIFRDPENNNAKVEFSASDGAYADDGVSLRTIANPASAQSIFRVLSSGGSQRLRVEHDGALYTSNYLEVAGTGNSYINGNLGIGLSAPNSRLDVRGASHNLEISNSDETQAGLLFTDKDARTTQYGKITFNSGNNNMEFFINNSTAKMTLHKDGRLGIGMYPTWNATLAVGGLTEISTTENEILKLTNSDGGYQYIGFHSTSSGSEVRKIWMGMGANHTNFYIQRDQAGDMIFNENNYGDFQFLNGEVRIGATDFTGCTDCGDYLLFVREGIRTEKVKVDVATTNNWADYVFEENYSLKSLEEVETYIADNGHLPNVPSAEEVVENGVDIQEMDATLLRKIEELTLYTIEQQKLIEAQQKASEDQQKKIEQLIKALENK